LTVFDPRDEGVPRAAQESRRLAQDRVAELARGAALARELPAGLDPASAEAASRLGPLLARVTGVEAQRAAKPVAELGRDRIETARPISLFEAAHRAQALAPLASPTPSQWRHPRRRLGSA
jgi:hypothetical protein